MRRRKRWESWQPEGKDVAGDMPDRTSLAWKVASPICRAAMGSNELAEEFHRLRSRGAGSNVRPGS